MILLTTALLIFNLWLLIIVGSVKNQIETISIDQELSEKIILNSLDQEIGEDILNAKIISEVVSGKNDIFFCRK